MSNIAQSAWVAALACLAFADATAAPVFRILYHEAIHLESGAADGHQQRVSFDAYGRHFSLLLQSNDGIQRAVPQGRADIEPLRGILEGVPNSWVRLTRTRGGWRGVIADGREIYAIEPVADIAAALVQPLGTTTNTTPVMYRFADALLPIGPVFCEILTPDGMPIATTEGMTSATPATAQTLYQVLARQMTSPASGPTLRLVVGVVADYEFNQKFSDDPEGAIIARMNIVDGIFSTQVGVKVSLAPLTVLKIAAEPFNTTDPASLLAQVRQYRGASPAQMALGVTHLMTGRDLDGDIVGLAYLGSVCNADTADSLSEGTHSTTMSALIAAHELGHNFNAPHDGVPGACASTPQTFLMAPRINFSSQFSSCSLQQIQKRIPTAQCLTSYLAPDIALQTAQHSVSASANTPFTLSFSVRAIGDDASEDVVTTVTHSAALSFQSALASSGKCTVEGGSVSCTLGTVMPGQSRQIDVQLVGAAAGLSTASLSVASSNDNVPTNDSAQVAISIAATPPPAAPATSSDAGPAAGGGGGRLDLAMLALLSATMAIAWRRRGTV